MASSITVMVVDDERYSREELTHLLSKYEFIRVVAEADSGESAVIKAIEHQPDCLFLDIEMPKMNGMDVAKSLQNLKKSPLLIFATAYPDFAAEAFRYEAVDYILKPFDENQIDETVKRIQNRLLPATPPLIDQTYAKLAVEGDDQIHYLHPNDIYYFYRDERVTKIVCKEKEYNVKTPLKELELRLASYSFFRIHKSYVVNLHYVTKLIPWFNGAYQLVLRDRNEQLSVSRNYVKALREKLEL